MPSTQRGISTPALALASVVLILLVAVPIILLLKGGGKPGRARAAYRDEKSDSPVKERPIDERPVTASGASPKEVSVEQIERVAAQFMRRVSSDDRAYVFPPYAVAALDDIIKRIEQYSRSTALADALSRLASAGPEIAAASRREGIEPGLVIYVALAETDGGRAGGEQTAAARRALPELLSLRKTLGTESADKSLILVAAYKMGGWTKKSHPLLGRLRRVVKNPLTDRNVWYLREHGGLDDEVYDFVVRFIALGIIGENPRRFGINTPPISF
ncbi:MAG TPA: hypothetical protein VKA70_05060 [Blastocatellia bacterium]|nr:hypothetical protein [Blastocatellia bacterium]